MANDVSSVRLPSATASAAQGAVAKPERTAAPARVAAAPVIPAAAPDPKTSRAADALARSTVLNQNKSKAAVFKAEVKEGWEEGGPLGIVGGALNGAGKALVKNNNPGKEPGKMGLFGLLKAVTAGVFIAAGTLINVGGIFTKNTYNEVKNFFGKRMNGPDHETAEKEYEAAKADYDKINKKYNDARTNEEPQKISVTTGLGDQGDQGSSEVQGNTQEKRQISAEDLEKLEKELEEARKRMDRAKRRMDRASEPPSDKAN